MDPCHNGLKENAKKGKRKKTQDLPEFTKVAI